MNGLVARGKALRKDGLKPGDLLIITKPIGTGCVLAAHMRGKAKARWIDAALTHMIQSNRQAAAILLKHGTHAATDITGFGLIGHLFEMVRAADVDVTVALDHLPFIEGARECADAGEFSSMQPTNLRFRRVIANLASVRTHPHFPLLFDPQTAGGLCASVPWDHASRCVEALKAAGYHEAAIIGAVVARSDNPEQIRLDVDGREIDRITDAGGDKTVVREPASVK